MRPVVALFLSNLLGTAVGGLFFLSGSWAFDLEAMGLYGVAISAQSIFVGLVGTGLHVAIVRLACGRLAEGDRRGAAGVTTLGLLAALAVSLFFAGVAAGSIWLADAPLLLPGFLLCVVVLWAGARSVLDGLLGGLLAEQRYLRASLLVTLTACTGLAALGIVWLRGPLTLGSLLHAHLLGLGASMLLGLGFLRDLWTAGPRLSWQTLKELIGYARWPSLSEGTGLLRAHLGPVLLLALAGPAEAGLFTLGRYPAFVFGTVAISLYRYWLPQAAAEAEQGGLTTFLWRQMRLAAVVGGAMLSGAVLLKPLLPWLGENFALAGTLFVLNTLDFVLNLLSKPIDAAFHGLRRPQLELLLKVLPLPVLLGASALWVPTLGAHGMAWAQVVASLTALLLGLLVLRRALRRSELP